MGTKPVKVYKKTASIPLVMTNHPHILEITK